MTWDVQSRIAFVRLHTDISMTADDAILLAEALHGWIGSERRPFALLVDASRVSALDSGFRATWGKFFRYHRGYSSLALFNAGPIVCIAAEMFRIGIGVPVKTFADEADARCWLQPRRLFT
jgi:hypothetical protein